MDIRRVVFRAAAVTLASLVSGCGDGELAVGPTPVPDANVTTVAGGSWAGSILLDNGSTTSFNMTLIARGLGIESGAQTRAQTPGTTDVTGQFTTGTGLEGRVEGRLEGTLQNGTFQGTLTSASPACAREYSGPITESTVAWIPRGSSPSGCPLTFSIQLPRPRGPDCQYAITLSQQTFSGNGGTGELTIETGTACTWAAEALVPWLVVDDPEPKLGPGTVTFTARPNDDVSREGRLRVASANQTFTITQGASCTYSVSPANVSVPAAGGSGTVVVTAPARCEWSGQPSVPWISLTPTAGAGSGTVAFTVQGTSGPPRTGTFVVAGQTVTVSQGSGCGASLAPTTTTIAAAGGGDVIAVSAAEGCAWTAQSSVPWIVLGATGGTGPRSLSYTVQPNGGPQRQGSVTVDGATLTVTQLSGCAYTVTPSEPPVVPSGGSDESELQVTTSNAACQWTAEIPADVDWILFEGNRQTIRGTGPGTLDYVVSPNESSVARDGSIQVTGDGAISVAVVIRQNGVPIEALCTYTVTPVGPVEFEPEGGDGTIQVTTSDANCQWTAEISADFPWLTFSPGETSPIFRTGSGVFSYTVDDNQANGGETPQRTGEIEVTGEGGFRMLIDITQLASIL